MNTRYLFPGLLSVCGFLILGLCLAHDTGHDRKKTLPPADRKLAAGQVSPYLFGDEVEFVPHDGVVSVYVNNRMEGPMQVQIRPGSAARNMEAIPALPVTYLLEAKQRKEVTQLQAIDPNAPINRDLLSLGIPGDPHAIPEDFTYSLPIDETSRWELGQEFNGEYSHQDDQNRYAVDFIVPVGTPVLAARPGVVMETIANFDGGGQNAKLYATRANFIRILHDDGSMGLYAHLQQNGVLVRPGQRVGIGEIIGYSGNTGFSSGPHLHFALQINTGMQLTSIPFRMVGPEGFLPLSEQAQ